MNLESIKLIHNSNNDSSTIIPADTAAYHETIFPALISTGHASQQTAFRAAYQIADDAALNPTIISAE